MKKCTKCKKMKDESRFCKRKRHKDGLSCWCKDCESAYARERYDKMRNRLRRYLRFTERHRVVKGIKQKICSRCKKWRPEESAANCAIDGENRGTLGSVHVAWRDRVDVHVGRLAGVVRLPWIDDLGGTRDARQAGDDP